MTSGATFAAAPPIRPGSAATGALAPVPDVVASITHGLKPLGAEVVPTASAIGRILAADVTAAWDLPRFANAAMDGFAVRAADCVGASPPRPVVLAVGEPSYAGHARHEGLRAGEASAVGTGAALPPGADAVVRRERTRRFGNTVEIGYEVAPGEDVRRQGEDAPRGAVVLRAGSAIGPGQFAALAGAGRVRVEVRRRPRAVVMLTGDEVARAGRPLRSDQVPDAIGPALAALLVDAGCDARVSGPVPDRPGRLRAALTRMVADLVVSVGGVSVGERDLLAGVAAELGQARSWCVALRPGSPFLSARIGGLTLLGLPGNPAAALVGFDALVRPVVRRLLGLPRIEPRLQATLASAIAQQPGRLHYVRAHAQHVAGGLRVRPVSPHGSGSLSSLASANAWIVLPPDANRVRAGSTVDIVPMWSGWLDHGGPSPLPSSWNR